jgi:prepilin signal peptidase PulO-like enzyme (type II secretory pathway)
VLLVIACCYCQAACTADLKPYSIAVLFAILSLKERCRLCAPMCVAAYTVLTTTVPAAAAAITATAVIVSANSIVGIVQDISEICRMQQQEAEQKTATAQLNLMLATVSTPVIVCALAVLTEYTNTSANDRTSLWHIALAR